MSFSSTASLPPLLVFGPQTEWPEVEALQDSRQELLNCPLLPALDEAVNDLPRFWQTLTGFDPNLRQVPGNKYHGSRKQWVKDGGHFPYRDSSFPHTCALALTVLLQITQYTRYLNQIGDGAHQKILDSVKTWWWDPGFLRWLSEHRCSS